MAPGGGAWRGRVVARGGLLEGQQRRAWVARWATELGELGTEGLDGACEEGEKDVVVVVGNGGVEERRCGFYSDRS
jgi:hypothetical protein